MGAESAAGNATIDDVARVAGVSRAAVSKVLREAYGVSESMRDRVNAAIAELDYRPRTAARAMRGRTYTLGIELSDYGNQFFTKVLTGASAALEDSRYQLMIAPAESGPSAGSRAIDSLLDRQVDGIIAISPLVSRSSLERIARSTPIVMFGRHDTSDRYDTVADDDVAGASAVMDHLLGLGHRRIWHLSRDELATVPEDNTPHGIRLQTYLDAMNRAGLADNIQVRRSGEGEHEAYLTTQKLLGELGPPTAIFAGHDALALGAMRAISERGVDVSIAGYDDVPIASHPLISLTTVSQPGELMGARAVTMLLERLAGRDVAAHEVFVPTLVMRDSTRPPASL
ncbi:LacI family DNA-binding transcriptional regulator [Microbacterium sp. 2FI]|uniref:LacI family DNA-binding transcriptional regulator n=1 Tax=Microbacterium sp. 2FI TaxID=2502193 RepID=UPI0010F78A4C|nr:LacI family DNA-binding transcriptional regulator [Microbacterium sp. 2FI]